MPRKINVQTLEKICCTNYVTLYKSVRDQETVNICMKYFNEVISLSANRGLSFRSELIINWGEFICDDHLNIYEMQMLLIPQAKQLYLVNILELLEYSVKKSIFEVIRNQCPFLETLELKSLRHSSLLIPILPSLTHLSKLILSGSDCDDNILAIIFKTCSCLKVLNISSCPITDKGIQNLYKPISDKLKKINIWRTHITVAGVVNILFFSPNLQKFDLPCWMLINALQEMIAKGSKDKIPQLRSLNHRDCSHMPIEKEWIFYSLIFPKIEKIIFCLSSSSKLQTVPFNALRHLHLKKLDLFLFDVTTALFDHYELIQSLKYCGKTITDLTIHSYHCFLDIYALGQCCPLLEKMSIDVQEIVFRPNSMEMLILQPFQHLTSLCYLRAYCVDNSEELIEAVKYLLRYCVRIKTLKLCLLWALTDDILLNIWSLNRMRELQSLHLECLLFITKHCIYYILRQENALDYIVLRNCLCISENDKRELQNFIAENRLDVYL